MKTQQLIYPHLELHLTKTMENCILCNLITINMSTNTQQELTMHWLMWSNNGDGYKGSNHRYLLNEVDLKNGEEKRRLLLTEFPT